jgi:uncharacterized membrane protein
MSPFLVFITSLAVGLVALALGAASVTKAAHSNVAAESDANTEARRAQWRWVLVGVGSLLLLVMATASFYFIWIVCAGEC